MTTSTRLATTRVTPADTGNWMDHSECRTHDPELWFPVGDGPGALAQAEEAKTICNTRCGVRDECLAWALAERMDSGVWGGTSEQDRRRLHRRKRRSYNRGDMTAVEHVLRNRLAEFRELEARGLTSFQVAREMGTNTQTVNNVRARLAELEQEVAA